MTARMIDRATFESLLGSDETFRHDVFSSLSHRLAAMIERVEELTLDPLESRLITYMLAHEQDGLVKATHQVIAHEIGSAREVVSRHLKLLSDKNLIRLTRGAVILKDRAALQQLTSLNSD
jgi:CRP/FNR family transcriptional regulator